MVLQQNSEVKFWGWAKSNEPVSIKASWLDDEVKVNATNQGTWEMKLKTPVAGGPYQIKIKEHD